MKGIPSALSFSQVAVIHVELKVRRIQTEEGHWIAAGLNLRFHQLEWQTIPAITRRLTSVGLKLGQRRRRWANIKPTLVQRFVFAGILKHVDYIIWLVGITHKTQSVNAIIRQILYNFYKWAD